MSVLLEEALKLTVPERRQLADDIYASIDEAENEFSLSDKQKERRDITKYQPDFVSLNLTLLIVNLLYSIYKEMNIV